MGHPQLVGSRERGRTVRCPKGRRLARVYRTRPPQIVRGQTMPLRIPCTDISLGQAVFRFLRTTYMHRPMYYVQCSCGHAGGKSADARIHGQGEQGDGKNGVVTCEYGYLSEVSLEAAINTASCDYHCLRMLRRAGRRKESEPSGNRTLVGIIAAVRLLWLRVVNAGPADGVGESMRVATCNAEISEKPFSLGQPATPGQARPYGGL